MWVLHNLARSNCLIIVSFWSLEYTKLCMGTTYYSLGSERTTSTPKIVISATGETLFGRWLCPSFITSKMEDALKTMRFITVSRSRNTGLVQLHSTVLALPPRHDWLLRAHTRTTPAALQQSAPNWSLPCGRWIHEVFVFMPKLKKMTTPIALSVAGETAVWGSL